MYTLVPGTSSSWFRQFHCGLKNSNKNETFQPVLTHVHSDMSVRSTARSFVFKNGKIKHAAAVNVPRFGRLCE